MSVQSGSGRSAVPTRPAMVGVVAAVAGLVAALIVGASLHRVEADPRQQGWNWDVLVGNPNQPDIPGGTALLARNPRVGAFSAVVPLPDNLVVDGVPVSGAAVVPVKGSVYPPLLEGRLPGAADEVLMGSDSLAAIHGHVGDTVTARFDGHRMQLRVVGRIIGPASYPNNDSKMGEGVVVSAAAADRLMPGTFDQPVNATFAVDYAPGTDRRADFASLRRDFGPTVVTALQSSDVVNISRVNGLVAALVGLLALLGAATLGHALVTSVRRNVRDLALLKTLGATRRQVSAAVGWQATAMAGAGLCVGVPLGVVGGRWGWNAIAGSLESLAGPVVPLAGLLAIPAVLLLANTVAAAPGWAAGRVHPATVLHAE